MDGTRRAPAYSPPPGRCSTARVETQIERPRRLETKTPSVIRELIGGQPEIQQNSIDVRNLQSLENILEFPSRYVGTTVIRLEENYRSTNPILAVANAVMAEAEEGFAKSLWSRRSSTGRPLLRFKPS